MKIFFTMLMFLASLGVAANASAFSLPKLTTYIESRVVAAETAMQTAPAPRGAVELTDYNVDFIAQAGFGISDVFHLTLYPELDLVFVPATTGVQAHSAAASSQEP